MVIEVEIRIKNKVERRESHGRDQIRLEAEPTDEAKREKDMRSEGFAGRELRGGDSFGCPTSL